MSHPITALASSLDAFTTASTLPETIRCLPHHLDIVRKDRLRLVHCIRQGERLDRADYLVVLHTITRLEEEAAKFKAALRIDDPHGLDAPVTDADRARLGRSLIVHGE